MSQVTIPETIICEDSHKFRENKVERIKPTRAVIPTTLLKTAEWRERDVKRKRKYPTQGDEQS